MNQDSPNLLTKTLAFASVAEIGTGLALMVDPALVIRLLLGESPTGIVVPVGQFLGITLFALGVACWPNAQRSTHATAAFRAMLTYNVAVAAFLAYQFVASHVGGALLWPAVVLHAVVAILMIHAWRSEPRTPTSDNGPR